MFLLVCYDIADDRRRLRVMKVLEGYGQRVQRSVFECDLDARQLERLKGRLRKTIRDSEDSLRYYHLCSRCLERVEVVNGPPPAASQLYFLV